jgi:hypothetical protein
MTSLDATTTATEADTGNAGDNSQKALNALRGDLRKYGQAEALGSASRPIAARRIVDAAYDGLLKEGDAEMVYGEYQSGMVAVGKKNPLTAQGNGEKVQISKFRQFIKVGMLPGVDARDLMQRVSDCVASLKAAGEKIQIPFDCMLNAARIQLSQPDVDLTDEQVTSCVAVAEKAAKEDLDKLIDLYRKAHKLAEALPPMAASVDALRDAIVECGGEVPAVTKAEKEAAEFAAKAAQFGYSRAA